MGSRKENRVVLRKTTFNCLDAPPGVCTKYTQNTNAHAYALQTLFQRIFTGISICLSDAKIIVYHVTVAGLSHCPAGSLQIVS